MNDGNMVTKDIKEQWHRINEHNFTDLEYWRNIPLSKIRIGNFTYGHLNIIGFCNPREELIIGSFCSIARDVVFLLGGEHNYKLITTYPFKNKFFNKDEALTKGSIIVDDDVWIGYRATILSGVHIGQGAVIGAGSTVSKDIPPYAIYGGNRIIKYRFNKETIKKLLYFDYSSVNKEEFINNINYFSDEFDIEQFIHSNFYQSHLKGDRKNERI